MILAPTNRRVIRPYDKPSFEHTQRYGLIRGHWANTNRAGLWLFNEGSGNTVQDLSGNGLTGTFNGDVSWSSGRFGSALDFPGTSDYITAPTPKQITNALTEIVWVKFDPFSDEMGLIRLEDTFFLIEHPTIALRFIPDVDGGDSITVNHAFSVGVWYQVAVTYNSSNTGVLYVDGVSIGSQGTLAVLDLSSSMNLVFGNYNASGGLWDLDGQISQIAIYNRDLSPGEIALLYREPFLGIEKRTALIYFFVPTGGVVYQELNLTVSADASVLESDTQQMIDTGKEVSADATASESDTQQMNETGKEVSVDASVSCTDLKVVFELNLTVTATGSVVATEAHTMMETGKSVTAVASPAVIDTQAMVEIDLGVSAEGSVSCTDTMGLLAHIAAFMILRQCTT